MEALAEPPLFSLSLSVKGEAWETYPANERLALAIAQKNNLSSLVARLLVNRDVALEDVASFMDPKLRALLPDPFHLKDMDKGSDRIKTAIEKKEKIAVFGDYDVDGATSSALLKRFFRAIGTDVLVYIPDRIKEGYGPNSNAMEYLAAQGITVCITVDCGTASFEPLAKAVALGIDVIVVDHHIGPADLPPAYAIINPNRLDETSPLKTTAAVGVAFLLVVALTKSLREAGWFKERIEPDLLSFLDLVALGTVCDVMPITGLNRAFVAQGLKILQQRRNIGLQHLCEVSSIRTPLSAYHLGFALGPRINAGGRVGEADLGTRLLSTENKEEAAHIAKQLDYLNQQRKTLENDVFQEAMASVEARRTKTSSILFAVGENWHPGIIGIVAGRLKEHFNLPVAVISTDASLGKASVRSIPGIDVGSALHGALAKGLLLAGGGHAMAAGFTVPKEKIEALHSFLNEACKESLDKKTIRYFDDFMSVVGLTYSFVTSLEQLGPYGMGNAEPRFLLPNVKICYSKIVTGDHIQCMITESSSYDASTPRLKAIAFRASHSILGQILLTPPSRLHVIVQAKKDDWGGQEKVQCIIEDIIVP